MPKVACIGECMIEVSEHPDGRITRAFGGDTLNTAVYLARLGVSVDYITALGDDGWSAEMLAMWRAEGVGTGRVLCLPGRLPGLYVIQTDAAGERRFSYWRDRAPARDIFSGPYADATGNALRGYTHLYLSGISLSLYGASGRTALLAALDQAKAAGTRIVFDTNFRPRGWPDLDEARAAFRVMFSMADVIFASSEDLTPLFGDAETVLAREAPTAEIVLKHATAACTVMALGERHTIAATPVAQVIDTTAAGDSFAAGYLAARLRGHAKPDAARAGHRIAGAVVQHRGAIIPREAMPKDLTP
jgi:2-dehydro-3-deoxygluconokinase